MSETKPASRPTHGDPRIAAIVARKLLPDVLSWLGGNDPETEVLADLERALWGHAGGYGIARSLEDDAGWDPDAELVEILESASHYEYDARRTLTEQWVTENSIAVPFEVGVPVETPRGAGSITEIYHNTAQCVVTPPDDPQFALGGGWIIAAELCKPLARATEA